MSIDLQFVELTADVLENWVQNTFFGICLAGKYFFETLRNYLSAGKYSFENLRKYLSGGKYVPWTNTRNYCLYLFVVFVQRVQHYRFYSWGTVYFIPLFSTYRQPNVFLTEAWYAPATRHRPWCEHCA